MDNRTVFTKTAKGLREAREKTRFLSRDVRKVLVAIDGTASVEDLLSKLETISNIKLDDVLNKLIAEDYIREFSAPVDSSGNTFFDFDSSDELENAHTQLTIGDFYREVSVAAANTDDAALQTAANTFQDTAVQQPPSHALSSPQQPETLSRVQIGAKRDTAEMTGRAATLPIDEIRARVKKEIEEEARRDAEAEARAQAEAKEQALQKSREIARRAAEAVAQREQEAQAKKDAELRMRRNAEEKVQQSLRLAAEAETRAEAEAVAAAQAKEQTLRKAKEAARVAAEALALREQKAREKLEAEEQARQKAEEIARIAALAQVNLQESEKAKQEAAAHAAKEHEEQARLQNEARARKEQEQLAQREAEARAKAEAKEQARLKAQEEAQRAADERARRDSEERARKDAKLKEKEQARQKAEEESRLASEERARRKLEALAKIEAEEQARRAAQEQAKQVAQEQARQKLEEAARAKSEHDARRQAKNDAKQAAKLEAASATEELRKRTTAEFAEAEEAMDALAAAELGEDFSALPAQKRRLTFAIPIRLIGIALLLLIVLAVAGLHLVPFDEQRTKFEQSASTQFGQPVKIGQMHFSLLPQPHWRLGEVAIGKDGQISVPEVQVMLALDHLMDEQTIINAIILHAPVIDEVGLGWLLFGRPPASAFTLRNVSANNVKLVSRRMTFPRLEASATIGLNGRWNKITLVAANSASIENMRIELQPGDAAIQVEASADKFSPPFGTELALEKFTASGTIHRGQLVLREFQAGMYDGIVKGTGKLTWGENWSLDGDLIARMLTPARFAPALVQSGALDGDMKYSMQAQQAEKLFESARLKGDVTIRNGVLLGADLASMLRGTTAEGKSSFNSLNASFSHEAGQTQVRKVNLKAGLISVDGDADLKANNKLDGNFVVRLASPTMQARSALKLRGTLSEPQFDH